MTKVAAWASDTGFAGKGAERCAVELRSARVGSPASTAPSRVTTGMPFQSSPRSGQTGPI